MPGCLPQVQSLSGNSSTFVDFLQEGPPVVVIDLGTALITHNIATFTILEDDKVGSDLLLEVHHSTLIINEVGTIPILSPGEVWERSTC